MMDRLTRAVTAVVRVLARLLVDDRREWVQPGWHGWPAVCGWWPKQRPGSQLGEYFPVVDGVWAIYVAFLPAAGVP
jgi:hypothetical protein